MEKVLKDYITICGKFKEEDLVHDKYKTEKHKLLREWSNAKYYEVSCSDDIIDFYNQDEKNFFNRFFYTKVINPCIKEELSVGEVKLLKFLFGILCEIEDGFVIYNMLDCFCDCNKGYTVARLADEILKREPDFKCALKYKFINIDTILEYSIQNLPESLFYSEEITLKVLNTFFKNVDYYEELAGKLDIDVTDNAKKYREIYSAYNTYLENTSKYETFENCLKDLKVAY